MKHLKIFEDNEWKETDIKLKLGKYVLLKTSKSVSKGETDFYSVVKDIKIYIDNNIVGNMRIDERGFNILYLVEDYGINYIDIIKIENTPKEIKEFKNIIVEYLLDCHLRMKLSNPDYGTYGIKNTSNQHEGRKNLMTHDFIEFVRNDFKTSDSILVKQIKNINENFPLYKDTIKYNL